MSTTRTPKFLQLAALTNKYLMKNVSGGNFPPNAVRSRLRSTEGVSHKSLLTAAIHLSRKLSFSALDPCSDSHLLGVSAFQLDAPLVFISVSPFIFQTGTKLLHNFLLISRCLEFNCITLVQLMLFNSCSALLCVLSNSNTA